MTFYETIVISNKEVEVYGTNLEKLNFRKLIEICPLWYMALKQWKFLWEIWNEIMCTDW